MIVYKLVRKMKDGTIKPLFINKTKPIAVGVWLKAEHHSTKGFSDRSGWHCGTKPLAPHLSLKGRVWVMCEVTDGSWYTFKRPSNQGGEWIIAEYLKVLCELTQEQVDKIND